MRQAGRRIALTSIFSVDARRGVDRVMDSLIVMDLSPFEGLGRLGRRGSADEVDCIPPQDTRPGPTPAGRMSRDDAFEATIRAGRDPGMRVVRSSFGHAKDATSASASLACCATDGFISCST